VELFASQSESSVLNFVLRLTDLSGFTQQQNVTFRLAIPDDGGGFRVIPFGFLYLLSADPSVRSINSISVSQGSILGGTPVVVMLRYFSSRSAYLNFGINVFASTFCFLFYLILTNVLLQWIQIFQ
jgi:hypothetical protein